MDDLELMLRRWEASGIITAAQAEEIRRHETSVRPKPRIPLIAEALGYLGAALVLTAALALAAQLWSEFPVAVRIAVLLAVTPSYSSRAGRFETASSPPSAAWRASCGWPPLPELVSWPTSLHRTPSTSRRASRSRSE